MTGFQMKRNFDFLFIFWWYFFTVSNLRFWRKDKLDALELNHAQKNKTTNYYKNIRMGSDDEKMTDKADGLKIYGFEKTGRISVKENDKEPPEKNIYIHTKIISIISNWDVL